MVLFPSFLNCIPAAQWQSYHLACRRLSVRIQTDLVAKHYKLLNVPHEIYFIHMETAKDCKTQVFALCCEEFQTRRNFCCEKEIDFGLIQNNTHKIFTHLIASVLRTYSFLGFHDKKYFKKQEVIIPSHVRMKMINKRTSQYLWHA